MLALEGLIELRDTIRQSKVGATLIQSSEILIDTVI